ncbi:MAG: hypothetical protein GXY83_11410 [Rhodopirellula sp.]|nr:hypothetical protein [Rhodopirellula sp.]
MKNPAARRLRIGFERRQRFGSWQQPYCSVFGRLQRRCGWLLVVLSLLAGLGAPGCRSAAPFYASPPAPVLPPTPTLEQIIQTVNANSSQIQSLSTSDATLSGPQFPTLRASVAFERPRRLRLRAETALTGPELDLGSNDEVFWFWIRRSHPPVVYYCRHEQFDISPARSMFPVRPEWLIESLGIDALDPNQPHQGPIPVAEGRFEVRTLRPTVDGETTKVTVIDGMRGLVIEQHLYDVQGRLLASSVVTQHRRDPLTGVYVPQTLDIRSPSAQFSMRLDLGKVVVNRLAGDPSLLWTIPSYGGLQAVDLCSPNQQVAPGLGLSAGAGDATSQRPVPNRARNRLMR